VIIPLKKHRQDREDQNSRWSRTKQVLLVILGLLIGFLSGYQFSRKTPEPWKPVLESSDFEYMDDVVNTALTDMKEAATKGKDARIFRTDPTFKKIEQSLFKLKYYYLPITEVRQLIYDAERLFYLDQKDQADHELKNARKLLEIAAQSDTISVEKPMAELIAMIDDLLILINKNSPDIPEKFSELGHRVNLMAYKGELIISGVKIPG
jgi:hypothetical protein